MEGEEAMGGEEAIDGLRDQDQKPPIYGIQWVFQDCVTSLSSFIYFHLSCATCRPAFRFLPYLPPMAFCVNEKKNWGTGWNTHPFYTQISSSSFQLAEVAIEANWKNGG